MKIRTSLFVYTAIFCFAVLPAFPQAPADGMLSLDGLVYGYNYDYSKRLLKKEKQIKVEGALENVTINVREEGKAVKTIKSNSSGLFYLKVPIGKVYSIELFKPGYATVLMTIDLAGVPADVASKGISFSGAELLMNSFQSKTKSEDPSIGRLYYSAVQHCMGFEENKDAPKKQREYIENSASLMLRAVQKNKNREPEVKEPAPETKISSKKEFIAAAPVRSEPVPKDDSLGKILSVIRSRPAILSAELKENDLSSFETDLKEARAQYEIDKQNVHTPADSMLLAERGQTLNALEAELSGAKKIIDLQQNKISTQNRFLILAVIFLLLLSAFLFFIFRYNREKKRTYLILKDRNQKITDSISYASRIQGAVLPSVEEVKKHLPKSFVYFRPKDVVSGDFYWVSIVNGKTVIACVDCTGHGVPGAFMSLIGNTLLNEIVNEKKIIEANAILKQLHFEIVKAFQQNSNPSGIMDGMDMSLCVIDPAAKKVSYAGAMNPVYVVHNGTVSLLKPDIRSIGGMKEMSEGFEFSVQTVDISAGMCIYMFTDGYMDQFGGPENKKFNIPNFKKMIAGFAAADMAQQGKIVAQTINDWKGDQRQIDDMLVIGFGF
ncbi:MAG: PP2C family protein-serine/threonine phosphatase [Bacteroidia bacterium]